jgi:16S rRNA (uracil1498-N3)-methyltransferase
VDAHAKAHAFVLDLDAPVLDDDDRHHLARVLRLRSGDEITVADGDGRWRRCVFGDTLEPIGPIEYDPAPAPELTIAFAVLKGDRTEWTVQKLTEVGVDRIVPFVADRSVVRWDPAKAAHHQTRLRRVARLAAMQSRRSRLPVVEPVGSSADIAARGDIALADPTGSPPTLEHPAIAVGPEGGWSDSERGDAASTVALATTTLRAETAAVAAGVLLVALREGFVGESDRHVAR